MIYLDNAATTYPKPLEVKEALIKSLDEYSFNAGRGTYDSSQNTFNMIEQTREEIAKFVNVKNNRVIFTSSATESLNMIINGLDINDTDNILVSPFEHNAILRPLHLTNCKLTILRLTNNLEIDFNFLIETINSKKFKAIFLSHVSNVLGNILCYEKVFKLCREKNIICILDAAQSFGTIEINKEYVDFIVFAGHKCFYTPIGIAGYIYNSKVELKVAKAGGTGSDSLNLDMPNMLPYKYECGSLPSNLIYSLNKGIDFVNNNEIKKHKEELSYYLINKLKELSNVVVYLVDNYTYGIVSFNVNGYTSSEVAEALANNFDIAVRSGYHCAPLIHDYIDSKKFYGTVRVSFSYFNTKDEIDYLIDCLKEF